MFQNANLVTLTIAYLCVLDLTKTSKKFESKPGPASGDSLSEGLSLLALV